MKGGVYLITCVINGNRYVGSSNNINYRWRKHKEMLNRDKHFNPHMQRSWNKYGGKVFVLTTLEHVENEDDLRDREQYYLDTLNPEFNITPHAHRPTTEGLTYTKEQRNNISEGNKRYWASLSVEERAARIAKTTRPHSEETKKLLSEIGKRAYAEGRIPHQKPPFTDEQKANIRAGMQFYLEKKREVAAQRKAKWEAGREEREMVRREKLSIANTGKTHSEETKAKLREAATLQMSDPEIKEKHQQAVLEAMQRPEVKKAMAKRPKMKHTKESKAKNAAAHRGRKNSPETIELMAQKRREWWANKKAEEAANLTA